VLSFRCAIKTAGVRGLGHVAVIYAAEELSTSKGAYRNVRVRRVKAANRVWWAGMRKPQPQPTLIQCMVAHSVKLDWWDRLP
jgi:hypothetical protein